jgi:hypothetical protein
MQNVSGIRIVYPDCNLAVFPLNQATINSERPNGTRHIATVARVIDVHFLHPNRCKGIIDISIWMR